ncbi:MAG: 7-cyano-7-deazaguanine synthase [Rhodobacteraceae bacterium]|nr:7-cyano-7-deazaguanine synthase [Paracoccaceae bacterium]
MKTLVVCSGGLDSVSLAHKVAAQQNLAGLISFDYGQRHKKEVRFAARAADRLGVPFDLIDMSHIGQFLSGSALTDNLDVHLNDSSDFLPPPLYIITASRMVSGDVLK